MSNLVILGSFSRNQVNRDLKIHFNTGSLFLQYDQQNVVHTKIQIVNKRNKPNITKHIFFIVNTLLNEYMSMSNREIPLHQNHALHYYFQHFHTCIVH